MSNNNTARRFYHLKGTVRAIEAGPTKTGSQFINCKVERPANANGEIKTAVVLIFNKAVDVVGPALKTGEATSLFGYQDGGTFVAVGLSKEKALAA